MSSKEKLFLFFSMTYFWNVSCFVVGVGWGKLTLVWYVELTSQTADEEVIFFLSLSRLFKYKVDRKTWDDSHVSPLPKAKKIYATVKNNWPGYFDRQRLLQNVPQKLRLAVAIDVISRPISLSTERRWRERALLCRTTSNWHNSCTWSRIKCYPDKECHRPSLRLRTALVESEVLLVSRAFTDCDRDRQRGSAIAVVTGYRLFLTPPRYYISCLPTLSQWKSVSMDTSLRPSTKGSSKLEKEAMFCLGQFPWSSPLTVDFLTKSLRLQAFLKGLGTKRAYSTAKRFAKLNYAGRLVSLSACARWKSLRRLLNEPPKVWIFAISCPICTWSMQAREAEGRNSREPWVYGCVLSFLFWSTDKDARSWFLGAHSGKTYQKSF